MKTEREINQDITAFIGTTEHREDIRPCSLATLQACQILGNKIGMAIFAGLWPTLDNADELTEFLWLHVADPSSVDFLVARARTQREAVTEAVLQWARTVSPAQFNHYREYIFGLAGEAISSDARVINNSKVSSSKN